MLRLDEYKEHNKKTFIFIKCKYKQKKGCMKRLYVARAAVQLGNDIPVYDKNTWYHIKTVNEIDYRWRFHNNYIYEVVAGVFQNKSIALKYAKSIYVTLAESAFNTGMKMTIYCGLLEHISEGGKKDACVITKIDELIENIRDSELLDDYKNQIINYLREGKEISANQKCKKVIAKYAKDKYGPFTANQVFDAAYRCRSAFSHGEGRNAKKVERIAYMEYLVLDVIKGYMLDMEKTEP